MAKYNIIESFVCLQSLQAASVCSNSLSLCSYGACINRKPIYCSHELNTFSYFDHCMSLVNYNSHLIIINNKVVY